MSTDLKMKNNINDKLKDYVNVCEGGWSGCVHVNFQDMPLSCLVDPDCLDERRSLFEKVQSSDTAEVYRYSMTLQNREESLYLKKYPHRSLLDALKHLLRPSRAKRAFEAGMMLEKHGLRTPRIIAFLQRKTMLLLAEDILITQEIKNAAPLPVVLNGDRSLHKPIAEHNKRLMIEELGRTIGQMHAAGICHGDLRAGNVFVREEGDRWRFIFIDNERTSQHLILPSRLQRKNLVQLNMQQANISATDRMRFLKAYRLASGISYKQAKRLARRVSKATGRRFKRRARTRTGIADASDSLHWNYQRARLGHLDGVFQTNFAKANTAAELLAGIDDLMETGVQLKNDTATRVVRCEYNGFDVVIKRYNYQGPWHALRHTVKGSRAKKCWRFGHLLNAAKIPCAAPLGMVEDRSLGVVRQSYIINAFIEGPMLYTLMTSPEYTDEQKQAARKKAEAILEQLAQHRMTHSDMKSVNMLVCKGQPVLIDLDSMQQHRIGPYFQLRYQKMLRKFKSRLYGRKKR